MNKISSAVEALTKSEIEGKILECLESFGWKILRGCDISPYSRGKYHDDGDEGVVLEDILCDVLDKLNPGLPLHVLITAQHDIVLHLESELEIRNRIFHQILSGGVLVEYLDDDNGRDREDQVQIIDFEDYAVNDWVAVSQFTVEENGRTCCPDIILFVNGLPLVIIEIENPSNEKDATQSAFQRLQAYKSEIPSLLGLSTMLVISDGQETRIGTLKAEKEGYKSWQKITGEMEEISDKFQSQVLPEAVFRSDRFLTLIRDFTMSEDNGVGH